LAKDEPEDDDVIVFDQSNCHRSTPVSRLLDNPGRPRNDQGRANPYTLKRRPRQRRPFLDHRTGETVYRLRGGKYVTPIYPEWKPDGLIRRLLPTRYPTPNGGRVLQWGDYPRGWSAVDPGARPYVMRVVAELALRGANVSGSNTPGAAAYAARAVKANRWASDQRYLEAASIGPRLHESPEPEPLVEPQWSRLRGQGWTAKTLKQIYKLETKDAERKADAGKRRAKTSEYRDEKTGEYGAVSMAWPNGVVQFAPSGLPVLIKRSPDDVQDDDYLRPVGQGTGFTGFKPDKVDALIEAALRGDPDAWSGKKVKAIQTEPPPRRKPGPRPKHDGTPKELARLRQIKRRCKQRGIPFVIEEHLQRRKLQRKKIHAIAASAPPPSGGEHGHVGTKHQRDPRGLEGRSSNAKPKTAG
jgi:hypothetical protein